MASAAVKGQSARVQPASTPRHDTLHGPIAQEAERAEAAGRREIARRLYESALYLLRSETEAIETSTILRRVGRLYFEEGDFAAGEDCLSVSIAIAEALGDSSAVAYATNILANSYAHRGQLDESERLYQQTLTSAELSGDAKLAAMVLQNLGILASMRGDLSLALERLTRSLEGYRSIGLDEYLGKLMNNIGMLHADMEQWDEAEHVFLEALAHCATSGDVSTSLMIEANRAEVQIALGRLDDAGVLCERVLRRAAAINDFRAVAEAHKHAGVVARERGRTVDAERHLATAFEMATDREDLLLAAETAREQAELFTIMGRNRDTLQALTTSHRLFRQLRAQRDLAEVAGRIRRLESRFLDLMR